MDTCFCKAATVSEAFTHFLNLSIDGADDSFWVPYYNFDALPIDDDFVDMEPFFKKLREKRQFHAGILRVPADRCYMWHVDTDRHSAINMLVRDNGDSKCVFAPGDVSLVTPIVELKYEPETLFAFNTKVLHTVINFSRPRYLFSVEFIGKDYGLPYDVLCSDLGLT